MATLSRLRQLKYVLDQTISFHNLIFCLIVFSFIFFSFHDNAYSDFHNIYAVYLGLSIFIA